MCLRGRDKHQHSTKSSRPSASPTPVERKRRRRRKNIPGPSAEHGRSRYAASKLDTSRIWTRVLAAIEHKWTLAEHPAHNVREDIRDIKLGPRGLWQPPAPVSLLLSVVFQNAVSLSVRVHRIVVVLLSGSFVYVARSMITAFTDDERTGRSRATRSKCWCYRSPLLKHENKHGLRTTLKPSSYHALPSDASGRELTTEQLKDRTAGEVPLAEDQKRKSRRKS